MNKKMIPLLLIVLLPIAAVASSAKAHKATLGVSYKKATHPLLQGIAELIVESYDRSNDQTLDLLELQGALKDLHQLKLLPPPHLGSGHGEKPQEFSPRPINEGAGHIMADFDKNLDKTLSASELCQLFQKRQSGATPFQRNNMRLGQQSMGRRNAS